MPSHTDWARGTFEQGAPSLLPELSAVMPAVVLPGPKLFQANRVDPNCMRPAVFHCFQSGAKTTLRTMALEGWETLLAVLLGAGHLRPLWQQTGWTPFGGMCWHGSASAATFSAPLQRHLMDLWKPSGQRHEPQWQLSSQEPPIHLHKPQPTVSQITVEPLKSARNAQLPGTETNATASPGGPLGPSADCSSPRPMPSTPLPSKYESTKQEEAQMPEAEPNASESPGRPLGLSAVNSASGSGQGTSSSIAIKSAKPEEADVSKLNLDASDQSGRPLGLSAAGSDAQSLTDPLLQIASESAKPEEVGEAEECMERPPPDSDSSRTRCRWCPGRGFR